MISEIKYSFFVIGSSLIRWASFGVRVIFYSAMADEATELMSRNSMVAGNNAVDQDPGGSSVVSLVADGSGIASVDQNTQASSAPAGSTGTTTTSSPVSVWFL